MRIRSSAFFASLISALIAASREDQRAVVLVSVSFASVFIMCAHDAAKISKK